MTVSSASVLKDLRDIPGVMGSFVLSAEGDPQLRDLPSVVPDEALSEVGPRVARLIEAAKQQTDVTQCTLRFTEHRLHLKPSGAYLLCVLSEKSVNQPTLQMGMTLVSKRLSTMDLSAPVVDRETIPSPSPPASPRPQMYRGRRID